MAQKARHAFGALENIDNAIERGVVDSYDILFVKDSGGKPYVGWIDKDGSKVIVQEDEKVVHVTELPTENGDDKVIYILNNEGYIWDSVGKKCVPLAKSADLQALETEIANKVDEVTVNQKIEEKLNGTVDAKISDAVNTANTYTDEKIEEKLASVGTIEIVEF